MILYLVDLFCALNIMLNVYPVQQYNFLKILDNFHISILINYTFVSHLAVIT